MERIPTTNGIVRCSRAHGANERAENIAIAAHFAEKYGHEIDLLPRLHNRKMPDAYNKTLNVEQEYKTNKKPTKGAIDNELRKAGRQANHIILHIVSNITDDLLMRGIKGRVKQRPNIETVTVVKGGDDKAYARAQILDKNFAL